MLIACKHTAASHPLISFRAIAEVYKEVGELFELSVVISENVLQKEDEAPKVQLKIVRADKQPQVLHRGVREKTENGVIKFKDMHLDAPCLDNCRLQAELVLPHEPLDNTVSKRTTIDIPLRIVAASWILHITRESIRGFKINVTHDNQPVGDTAAKIAVCTMPCLPWGGDKEDNMLLATQSIKLDDTGSWRGKLPANAETKLEQLSNKKPARAQQVVYVKIAGRILRQELPAMELQP